MLKLMKQAQIAPPPDKSTLDFSGYFGGIFRGRKNGFTLVAVLFHPTEQSKRTAFTLAEVLITLGIIGVVAALTMPALIQHYKKKETSTKIEKFYSVMSQAIKLSEVENGPSLYWEFEQGNDNDPAYREEIASNKEKTFKFFDTYLDKYIPTVKKELAGRDENGVSTDYPYFVMKDGSIVYFHRGICFDMTYDTNGQKKPNASGRDRFKFLLCTYPNNTKLFINNNTSFAPGNILEYYNIPRNEIISKCKNGRITACTNLLCRDGWEFKKDYPLKL